MNQLEPNDLLLFARVVEEGSFSRAGERLGLPKSTVSRRLAALETQLGERMLHRTTRKLMLTDFGHSMLAHARQVADEVDAAVQLAQHRQVEPSGRLRVSMPGDFTTMLLSRMLAEFVLRYPAISLELDLSPRKVDLIGENFDVTVRMGDLADDASLAARRVAVFSHRLYASPGYLKKRGEPAVPEALMEHDTVQLLCGADPLPWVLNHGGARWEGVPPVRARANSPELLTRLARGGAGIASVNDHFAAPYVESGELVPVLVEWTQPSYPVWAVFPGRRLMPARTRVFLDALAAEFNAATCQVAPERASTLPQERVHA